MSFFTFAPQFSLPILIFLAVLVALFLVFREIACWYLKINKQLALLEKIDAKLSRLPEDVKREVALAGPNAETTAVQQPPTPADPVVAATVEQEVQEAVPTLLMPPEPEAIVSELQRVIDECMRKHGVGSGNENWNIERLLLEADNPELPENSRKKTNMAIAELMGIFNIYRENHFWCYGETRHPSLRNAIEYSMQMSGRSS